MENHPTQSRRVPRAVFGWLACASAWLLSAAVSPDARAATYFVRADGNDANTGRANSANGAWRTISKANPLLVAGDTLFVVSVSPADTASTTLNAINPASAGTGYGEGLIVYRNYNAHDPTQWLPVPPLVLSKNYIKVSGFRIRRLAADSTGVALGFSRTGRYTVVQGSTVDSCYFFGGSLAFRNALRCKLSNSRGLLTCPGGNQKGAIQILADYDPQVLSDSTSKMDTILTCTIVSRNIGASVDSRWFGLWGFTRYNYIKGNTFHAWWRIRSGGDPSLYGLFFEESYSNTFEDNTWIHEGVNEGGAPSTDPRWMICRSGDRLNVFRREKYLIGLSQPSSASLDWYANWTQESGSLPSWSAIYGDNDNTKWNTWDGCLVKSITRGPHLQHDAKGLRIVNCVFANAGRNGTREYAFTFFRVASGITLDSCTIAHNTFYSRSSFALTAQQYDGARQWRGTGNRFGNNVLVGYVTSGCPGCLQAQGNDACGNSAILQFGSSDTTGANFGQNLFYSRTGASSRAIRYTGGCSPVGGTNAWGNPAFADTNWATLDLRPLAGSAAVGAQWPDGYVGAFSASGPPPTDVTPPAAVTNLAAQGMSNDVIQVSWIAPGDDGMTGAAAAYDLRWSLQPITSANFSSATVVGTPPVPAVAGTAQSYVMMGLSAATTYYFALKTRDEANNWSAISNIPSAATTATDQTSPASVQDLSTAP